MKRQLGSFPPDFEPWFTMWDSVLFFPTGDQSNTPLYGHIGDLGSIPCHQHRACKALVKCEDKYPPRHCPHCGVDTKIEEREARARGEAWLPVSI